MSLLTNRSAMVLFHDDIGHRSQKVRIVIAEKGISCNLEVLSKDDLPKEILEINIEKRRFLLAIRTRYRLFRLTMLHKKLGSGKHPKLFGRRPGPKKPLKIQKCSAPSPGAAWRELVKK